MISTILQSRIHIKMKMYQTQIIITPIVGDNPFQEEEIGFQQEKGQFMGQDNKI